MLVGQLENRRIDAQTLFDKVLSIAECKQKL